MNGHRLWKTVIVRRTGGLVQYWGRREPDQRGPIPGRWVSDPLLSYPFRNPCHARRVVRQLHDAGDVRVEKLDRDVAWAVCQQYIKPEEAA